MIGEETAGVPPRVRLEKLLERSRPVRAVAGRRETSGDDVVVFERGVMVVLALGEPKCLANSSRDKRRSPVAIFA